MWNASLQEDERSPSPVHCLCRVSEMLRLILSFPSPLRCSQQLKHSQLPRNMEYLWIPLITEAETIPASIVWHAVGLASYRGAELAPRRFFHHLGADQQSAQFRQQFLARALGMEMPHTWACTSVGVRDAEKMAWAVPPQLRPRKQRNSSSRSSESLAIFSPLSSCSCAAYGVCFPLQNKYKPKTASKEKQAVIFFFLVLLYFPFPQLMVTEGIGRINHEKRACSLVKMKSNREEQGLSLLSPC